MLSEPKILLYNNFKVDLKKKFFYSFKFSAFLETKKYTSLFTYSFIRLAVAQSAPLLSLNISFVFSLRKEH